MPGEIIQGLRIYKVAGKLYQIVDHHKWIIYSKSPEKIIVDQSSSSVNGIQAHVPVYMEGNSLGNYLLNEETSKSVLSTVYSNLEQAVYDSTMVYFLHGFSKLNTISAQKLRIYLKNRCNQDGVRMFQQVRCETAFEYAAFFSRITVVLYRNGRPRPSGEFLSRSFNEGFVIEDENKFQDDHDVVKDRLAAYKRELNDTNQECYEYPHPINKTPDPLNINALKYLIQTGDYNTLFSLECIHKWWCLELLNKPEEHMPLHFQAFGALLQENREIHCNPAKATRLGSGILYGLRLVVWNELTMRQEINAYQCAWNLCTKGLGDSSHIQYFYTLLDDIYEVNNVEGGAFRVVLDTRVDRIHFNSETLMFNTLKNGVSRWCESLVSDYRYLVMNKNIDIQGDDQLGNAVAGYSFAEENNFLKEFLRAAETSGGLYDHTIQNLHRHLNEVILTASGKAVLSNYVSKAEKFLLSLMTLIRISTLGACRATELRNLTFRNKYQVMRAICFDIDMAFIVLNSSKNEMSPRLKQYIPQTLSDLLKGYLILIRPLVRDIYAKLDRHYDPDFRYYLMHNYTSKFSVTKIRETHKNLTKQFFGVSIGYVSWRHAMEVINVVLYKEKDHDPKLLSLLRYASRYLGHTEKTAQKHYGHGSMRRNDTLPLLDGVHRDLARAFHCWLGYEDLEPILETTAYVPKRVEELEIINREYTLDDIREKLPGFTWRSVGQEKATLTCLARKESFTCILPTGGGKSMTFVIPILFEPDLHTVIVVPFTALKNDIIRTLSRFGIAASTQNVTVDTDTRVHVVTQDTNMLKTVTAWHNAGKLARIVIDEVHELNTDWRDPKIISVLNLDCQKVFLSATLPREKIVWLKKNYSATQVIRERTIRPNIEYKVVKFQKRKDMTNALRYQMEEFASAMEREGSPSDQSIRALIYLTDRLHLEEVLRCIPETIKCAHYFSETINREAIQNRFFNGEIQCLVATKAFSTGIDYPNVTLVIHWDGITSISDFEQCSGRAGRNGQPACSIVIASSKQRKISTGMIQDERLAINYIQSASKECLRSERANFFDGKPIVCREAKATLCSSCEKEDPLEKLDILYPKNKSYATTAQQVREFLNQSRVVNGKMDYKHYCIYKKDWTRRISSEKDSFILRLSGLNSGHCKSCGFKETQNSSVVQHERSKDCPFGHCMQEALEIVYGIWVERKDIGNQRFFDLAMYLLQAELRRRVFPNEAFIGKGELDGDLVIVALAVFYIAEACMKCKT